MNVPPPPPAAPSWLPDPTGRFAHRWFDGSAWTDHVAAADGSQAVDPMTVAPPMTWDGTPDPAQISTWPIEPQASTHSTVPALVGADPQATAVPRSTADTARRGVDRLAIALAAVGAALIAACLFVLPWLSSGPTDIGFGDLADIYDAIPSSALETSDQLDKAYVQWAGYALAAAALITTVVAIVGRNGAAKIAAAVGAAIGAVYHTYFLVRGTDGVEFGAWLAPAGYFVLIIALAVAAVRRPT